MGVSASSESVRIDRHTHGRLNAYAFEAWAAGCMPAEDWQPQKISVTDFHAYGTKDISGGLFADNRREPVFGFSAANATTISAALLVHSFTRMEMRP